MATEDNKEVQRVTDSDLEENQADTPSPSHEQTMDPPIICDQGDIVDPTKVKDTTEPEAAQSPPSEETSNNSEAKTLEESPLLEPSSSKSSSSLPSSSAPSSVAAECETTPRSAEGSISANISAEIEEKPEEETESSHGRSAEGNDDVDDAPIVIPGTSSSTGASPVGSTEDKAVLEPVGRGLGDSQDREPVLTSSDSLGKASGNQLSEVESKGGETEPVAIRKSSDGGNKQISQGGGLQRGLSASSSHGSTSSLMSRSCSLVGTRGKRSLGRAGSITGFLDIDLGESYQRTFDETVELKKQNAETQASLKAAIKRIRSGERDLSQLSNRVNHLKKEHRQLRKRIEETHRRADQVEDQRKLRLRKESARREAQEREKERLRKEAELHAKRAQETREKAKRSAEAAKLKKKEEFKQCVNEREKIRLEKKKLHDMELEEKRKMREARALEVQRQKQKEREKARERRKAMELAKLEEVNKNKERVEERRKQLQELEEYEAALIAKLQQLQQDEDQAYHQLEETI